MQRWRMLFHAVAALAMGVMLVGVSGCQEPLFADGTPRSQYERFDALRGDAAPRYEPQRGRGPGPRRPALRERLAPRDGYAY